MSYIQIPSVCLPRVWFKFDKNYIEGIFCELFGPAADGESCVIRIDLIPKKDRNTGEDFWVVFVHFSSLMIATDYLQDFVERINANEEIKIQYNPPWFWKVRKNTGTRRESTTRTGPRIMSRKDEEELMKAQREILSELNNTSGKSKETNDESKPLSLDGDYGCYTNAQKRREQRNRASEREMERSNSEPVLPSPPPPSELKRSDM